jgi:hypothetical protein
MKYLKLFENFVLTELDPKYQISDKTIDDVLKDDFFKDEEEKDDEDSVERDIRGVYKIKNWLVY